ncbi:MAG: acyltransferase 3 [Belnapia sp.]|nr:acyltransferase 3 [Belnapia sp.]
MDFDLTVFLRDRSCIWHLPGPIDWRNLERTPMAQQQRSFHTLDGIRGVAALLVACFHLEIFLAPVGGSGALFPEGYLAVDLFFVLSGFVLEHAYADRLRAGLRARAFMTARIIRLYPLYLLGVAIGLASAIVAYRLGGGSVDGQGLVLTTLAALLLLPSPTAGQNAAIFILNAPGWSLFFELLVNLAFVLAWRRLSTRLLLAIVVVSGIALAMATFQAGHIHLGPTWPDFLGGVPRVAYSFFIGVLIRRLYQAEAAPASGARQVVAWGLAGLLPLILLLPPSPALRPWFDLACVLVAFPILIALGARYEPGAAGVAIFRFLGLVSYPVYAIHFPLMELLRRGLSLLRIDIQQFAVPLELGCIAALVAAGWLLFRMYDLPARAAAAQSMRRRQPA